MLAAPVEQVPASTGGAPEADRDAETRCAAIGAEAESAARAPATDVPTADTPAADAAGPVSMPSEQPQEMATTPAGVAEPSVLPAEAARMSKHADI